MDERNIKITAVVGAVLAVIAVGFLLVTTYGSDDDTQTALEEEEPVDGERAPSDPVPGAEDDDVVPEAGAGHDDFPADAVDDPEIERELTEQTVAFFETWLTDADLEDRQDALEPHATPAFIEQMELTDPQPLPDGPIVGEPEVVALQAYAGATEVRLEGGVNYRANLIYEPEGWLVNELIPDEDSPGFQPDSPDEEDPDAPDNEDGDGADEPTDDGPTDDGAGEDGAADDPPPESGDAGGS